MSDSQKVKKTKKKAYSILIWKITALTFLSMLLLLLSGIGGALGYSLSVLKKVPPLNPKQLSSLSANSYIYDRNEQLLGQVQSNDNRQLINSLSEVSPFVPDAFISGEDKTFYTNIGVDPFAILRSAFDDIFKRSNISGASTITQQTIKNIYFPDFYKGQRGLSTKIQEADMAIQLQRMLSKDQIMVTYLNCIYFGKSLSGVNMYGIQAASKAIFGIPAKNVNIAQAAVLASLPNSPGNLNPFTNLPALLDRQHYILTQMKQNGYIDEKEFTDAESFDIKGSLVQTDPIKATLSSHPYLISEIQQRAAEVLLSTKRNSNADQATNLDEVEKALDSGGYKIYTTVDEKMQNVVEGVLSDDKNFAGQPAVTVKDPVTGKNKKEILQAGVSLIDNKTGGILAVGGGRNFNGDANNHTILPRQPGSTMKPLAVYGPAVDRNIISPGMGIDDVPFAYPGTNQYPQNWDSQYRGWVSARVALTESYDVPAIKLFQELTPQVGLSYVKKMGVTTLTDNDYYLPAAIGGLYRGVTLEENTSAYTTFANQGIHKESYLIDRIVDREGNVVYNHQPEQTKVFTPQTAFMLTDMLKDVVDSQLGTAYRIGSHFPDKPIAGKTGTTNDDKDIWFVGYTPDITLGVWEGYNIPYPIQDQHQHLFLWNTLMDRIYPLINKQTDEFPPPPEGVQKAEIFVPSGKIPSDLDRQYNQLNKQYADRFGGLIVNDWMTTDMIPTETDDMVVRAKYMQVGNQSFLVTNPNTLIGGAVSEKLFIRSDPFTAPQNVTNYSPPWDSQWELQQDTLSGTSGNSVGSPQDLKAASLDGQNAINLSWSNVNGADGYVLWRSENNGPFHIISDELGKPGYVDNHVNAMSIYSYKISSVANGTIQDPGNVASATNAGNDPVKNEPVKNDSVKNDPVKAFFDMVKHKARKK